MPVKMLETPPSLPPSSFILFINWISQREDFDFTKAVSVCQPKTRLEVIIAIGKQEIFQQRNGSDFLLAPNCFGYR